jgi:hypothetical protein
MEARARPVPEVDNLWADFSDVESSASNNLIGPHGLLEDSFTFY